jgi:hypothetical protein
MVEKENVTVRISYSNFIVCEKKRSYTIIKILFTTRIYTQILYTFCSQCKRISESLPVV